MSTSLLLFTLTIFVVANGQYSQLRRTSSRTNWNPYSYSPPATNFSKPTSPYSRLSSSLSSPSSVNPESSSSPSDYGKFNPYQNMNWVMVDYYGITIEARNQLIQDHTNEFISSLKGILLFLEGLTKGEGISLKQEFLILVENLYYNMWSQMNYIGQAFIPSFQKKYLAPHTKKLIETTKSIQKFLTAQDRFTSKKIVIKGSRNVLTANGTAQQSDFTSIVGKDIQVNGVGNVIAGDNIALDGSSGMILGKGIKCSGNNVFVIGSNIAFSENNRMMLGKFMVTRSTMDQFGSFNYVYDVYGQ